MFHVDGEVPYPKSISRAWRTAAERAKVPVKDRDPRRTVAGDTTRSGTPDRVVMMQLGHKTHSMLERYKT